MDVVKTNLDRLGGKVEIKSEIGKGSLFRIKLPLTLAIIPSLIVSVEKERFAIPQINVRGAAAHSARRGEDAASRWSAMRRCCSCATASFRSCGSPILLGIVPTYDRPGTDRR